MLIGIISDTHLQYVTADFMKLVKNHLLDCDAVVHAGDFTDTAVYHYLNDMTSSNLVAVYGNMDPPELRQLLPEKKIFERKGIRFGLIHGWGSSRDLEERIEKVFADDEVQCIIYGHSHSGVNHKRGKVLFFNPGSPTDKHFAKANSIGFIVIEDHKIIGDILTI